MIRVLIVDDSITNREQLRYILSADPEIEVVSSAANGADAVKRVAQFAPDVVTMDINMPVMNGIEATRQIMRTYPVPIVIVSANWTVREVKMTFEAMEAGAVTLVEKPVGLDHPCYKKMTQVLIETVKLMAEVRVVKRWNRDRFLKEDDTRHLASAAPSVPSTYELVVIGASTGGPPVLRTILSLLPHDFPLPILIVQHIANGFLSGMVNWLEQVTLLPVHIAEDGQSLQPGHVYFAPDNRHMGINKFCRVVLSQAEPEHNLRPSVSHLFRSAALAAGPRTIGVLLTGMGKDGAAELKMMREFGAMTIAQDQKTCVVFGMPGAAIELNAAIRVLPPELIAATLTELMKNKAREDEYRD